MGAVAKPDLVLVPGLMCTADLYAGQIAGLAGQAQLTVADHRRHADLPGIAKDILSTAPDRFALAGLSMGGYVAFEMLRQAPRRITKLALLDTNARADRTEQTAMRHVGIGMAKAMGARAAQAYMIPKLIHERRLNDRDLVERIMAMADAFGVPAFERQQLAIAGRPDNRPFMAQISCPTVVIVGAQDALTPVKVAREMADGIAGARLEIIPDCGHLSAMEQPAAVNAILAQWLAA